jgi:ribosomal protein L11 methyltransferase
MADSPFLDYDNIIPHLLYRVDFAFASPLSGAAAEKIGTALEELGLSVFLRNEESSDGDRWTVSLTTYGAPDLKALHRQLEAAGTEHGFAALAAGAVLTMERLPEKDWLRHVHENFPPVTAGRFFIYGSHYTGEKPLDLVPLCIDAATAFGSGEHETTKACLIAFDRLATENTFRNGLDMGCGSGILAIGMTRIWPGIRVTAIDIDPESIIVSGRHAAMNNVTSAISLQAGDGYAASLSRDNAPYDLIAANILAGPLVDMASDLYAALRPGGFCVLSGLLARQEDEVAAAHTALGLQLTDKIAIGEWRALVLRKSPG